MFTIGKVHDLELEFLGADRVEAIPEDQRTVVCDPRSADEIILAAVVSNMRCSLRTAGGLSANGRLARKKKSETLHFHTSTSIEAKPDESVLVSFWVFNEFYAFQSVITGCKGDDLALETPTVVQRIHRRRLDRTDLPSAERFPVNVREMSGQRHLFGVVTDLSPVGFGIEVPLDKQRTAERIRGLNRDLVLVADIPGNPARNSTPAKVAHLEVDPGASVARLGVACTVPLAVGDEPSLEDFLLERRYPDVVRACTDADYEKIWQMLFSLEKVVHVDAGRKESSVVTWKKTSWSPAPLHRIYLLRNPEDTSKTQGTLSVSRFYNRTWLIHQLAVDGTRGRVLSHQLYGRVLDFLRQTAEVKFTIGTWPKEARVFHRYYLDFIQADPDPSNHYLEPCLILEFPVAETLKELEGFPGDNLVVRPFDYGKQDDILRFLRSKYPPIFLQALDLDEYRMCLEDVRGYYDRVALQRNREILLAFAPGEVLVGFALVEYGSANQNIFSLFDNFRLFTLFGNGPQATLIRKVLLEATMRVYARAGISRAITWTSDPEMETCVSCCRRELDAYFWIANAKRTKAFLRHLDRLHGRMSTRRAARDERSAAAQ
ncbi:MAG TPA: hypothetical protein VI895_02740 [Bdellovibrionota bacterium]|nr:hypothetical protein [Bdellovibrionota bacterium]